ncbi:MAG TPA: multicopper oxidase domain-containing protein [Actinomycetes bacterium]|nr:multicopper oxidase domain-containing protein [Actinomycetes bacterium]
MRLSRRQFLTAGAVTGATLALPWHLGTARALAQAAPPMDPTEIPKFQTRLVIPPAMPLTTRIKAHAIDYYVVAVVEFLQQILPAGLPGTKVWSYQLRNDKGTRNYPAFTIEARADRPVRVQWINGLVDAAGNYIPHVLPIDPTLHWANPPGGVAGRDSRPTFTTTPGPYTGPVPIVTHLHGGHSNEDSDGYPEAWYLPAANNLPAGYATVGSFYDEFKAKSQARTGALWKAGTAVSQYENDQPATTLWFHDHTLGMTRANVYVGPVGFYLLRGGPYDLPPGVLPGPAPGPDDPAGTKYYEIPLAIQDRSFSADGSLFYPDSRAFFEDGFGGPYIPDSDVPPIWNPEFFGNAIVVNGRTWPYLEVEPRRYRLRLLNGCNARFLILRFDTPELSFWQIGADGGFLPTPARLERLLMGPAERADVIVDFSGAAGRTVRLLNVGPDEPFGGGEPEDDFEVADPDTTGQVMQFRVTLPLSGTDTSTPPEQLTLPAPPKPGPTTNTRQVSLNEAASTFNGFDGPVAALLGTLDPDGSGNPLRWADPVTENVAVGAVEEWELHNFTEDAHPIHIHEIQFQVVNRQPFEAEEGGVSGPEPWEAGLKDTVVAYPEQITRVKAHYDRGGLFVWHCHILEHEDNEMMRPYRIG